MDTNWNHGKSLERNLRYYCKLIKGKGANPMSENYEENYFNDSTVGYKNYTDYPHFQARAQWIYDAYTSFGYSGTVYILGCAYGYIIKHLLEIDPTFPVYGIEFSQYAYDQSAIVGVQDRITLMDAQNFTPPNDMNIVISWNFFDALDNITTARNIISKINNSKCKLQMHIICTADEGYDWDSMYLIRSLADWKTDFEVDLKASQLSTYLIEYHTKNVWRCTSVPTWELETGLQVPLCWDLVTN